MRRCSLAVFSLLFATAGGAEPPGGMVFEPSADAERYVGRGSGGLVSVAADTFTVARGGARIRGRFLGARADARVKGTERLRSQSHYLRGGDPAAWRTSVPNFARVRVTGAYPGVEIEYYQGEGGLEFDLTLQPGVAFDGIRMAFEGAESLDLDDAGALVLKASGEMVRQLPPQVLQHREGEEIVVASRYRLLDDGSVGFEIGDYDASLPLVIDPVLQWATFLGGAGQDQVNAAAVDSAGFVYVAGFTSSANFPAANAQDGDLSGPLDGFISKLSPDGTQLIWSTFLGGSLRDEIRGMRLDAAGNIYVSGATESTDFPTTAGAAQRTLGGAIDAFVSKLTPDGTGFVYSTLFGGSGIENGRKLAVDALGAAYVTGEVSGTTFPVSSGAFQRQNGGGFDAFVAKVNAAGSAVDWATYFGGNGTDLTFDLVANPSGGVLLGGGTNSTDFPGTANAFQRTSAGLDDGYVARFTAAGAVDYFTYIGGSGTDQVRGLAPDASGNVWIAGGTGSQNFPTTANAPNRTFLGGPTDGFLARLPLPGASHDEPLVSYAGDELQNFGLAIVLEPGARAALSAKGAGQAFGEFPIFYSLSNFTPTPIVRDGQTLDGSFGVLTEYDGNGIAGDSATIPGADGLALAMDVNGRVTLAGIATPSAAPTRDVFQSAHAGGTGSTQADGWVMRYEARSRVPGPFLLSKSIVDVYDPVTQASKGTDETIFEGDIVVFLIRATAQGSDLPEVRIRDPSTTRFRVFRVKAFRDDWSCEIRPDPDFGLVGTAVCMGRLPAGESVEIQVEAEMFAGSLDLNRAYADAGEFHKELSVGLPQIRPREPIPMNPAFQCMAGVDSKPTVRAEGYSELIGDIVMSCTGGIPTPVGQPVPLADIQVTLNTDVTSRLIGNTSLTEALLLIGEPSPGNQAFCGGGVVCPVNGVGGAGLLYNLPSASENQGQPVRNVFQGRQAGANTVVWTGIPMEAPGSVGTRLFRIKNVRASVAGVSGGQGPSISSTPGEPQAISAFLRPTFQDSPLLLPIVNNQGGFDTGIAISVADTMFGLRHTVSDVLSHPVCQDVNPDFAGGAPPGGAPPPQPSGRIEFTETFPDVFLPRIGSGDPFLVPVPDQNSPSQRPLSESGFYNSLFPGNLGLADHGTRLRAVFDGIPAGAFLYVDVSPADGSSSTIDARLLQDCSGQAQPAAPLGGYNIAPLPIQDGVARACWEVIQAGDDGLEMLQIQYYLARLQGPEEGRSLVFVNLGFHPTVPTPQTRVEASQASSTPNFGSDSADPLSSSTSRYVAFQDASCDPGAPSGLQVITGVGPNAFQFITDVGAQKLSQGYLALLLPRREPTPTPVTVIPVANTTPRSVQLSSASWLTVSQSQETTPMTVRVETNPAGLAPGIYEGAVRFDAPGESLETPVTLTVLPAGPTFEARGVVGAADYNGGAVTPGQAIVVFGSGYGPNALTQLQLDDQGRVATELAETRILFDGTPAPMIYAFNGQSSAFVPFDVAGKTSTEVTVEYRGASSAPVSLPVLPALPGIFSADGSGTGPGAILNQDGVTLNSRANPAAPGEVLIIFASGAGQTDPPGEDGRLAGAPLPALVQPARALIDGRDAEVLYAGPAPGLAEGVLQVNARIPPGTLGGRDVEVTLIVGGFRSQPGITAAIR